jgi:hypothetical protein
MEPSATATTSTAAANPIALPCNANPIVTTDPQLSGTATMNGTYEGALLNISGPVATSDKVEVNSGSFSVTVDFLGGEVTGRSSDGVLPIWRPAGTPEVIRFLAM